MMMNNNNNEMMMMKGIGRISASSYEVGNHHSNEDTKAFLNSRSEV